MKEYDLKVLPGLSFANLAREFGCEGIRVEKPDAIKAAIEKGFACQKPTLIDVVLDPEESFPSD